MNLRLVDRDFPDRGVLCSASDQQRNAVQAKGASQVSPMLYKRAIAKTKSHKRPSFYPHQLAETHIEKGGTPSTRLGSPEFNPLHAKLAQKEKHLADHSNSVVEGYSFSSQKSEATSEIFHLERRSDFRARVTGQVKACSAILRRWKIDDADGAIILGYNDVSAFLDLSSGNRVLQSRDEKDRVRLLIDIYEGLFSLFNEPTVETQMINSKIISLGNRSVFDLMTEGSFLCLYEAREYVFHLNGRR